VLFVTIAFHTSPSMHHYVEVVDKLAIVFTRAVPAFEDLFDTCIWFLPDINTVHTTVKKETFEYLLTSM